MFDGIRRSPRMTMRGEYSSSMSHLVALPRDGPRQRERPHRRFAALQLARRVDAGHPHALAIVEVAFPLVAATFVSQPTLQRLSRAAPTALDKNAPGALSPASNNHCVMNSRFNHHHHRRNEEVSSYEMARNGEVRYGLVQLKISEPQAMGVKSQNQTHIP